MSLFLKYALLPPELPDPDRTQFPFTIPALRTFRRMDFTAPVTILIGENGIGKSTLLEAIAVSYGFSAEGGSLNHQFRTKDTHSPLHELLFCNLYPKPKYGFFLRAESLYNFFSFEDQLVAETGRPGIFSRMHRFSHGESFMEVMGRLPKQGLYLMDEPEAALSPSRQLQFLVRLHEHVLANGSQFVICTHSPILMAYPGADLHEITEEGIRPVEYDETDHVRLTRDFLKAPGAFLKRLLRNQTADEI